MMRFLQDDLRCAGGAVRVHCHDRYASPVLRVEEFLDKDEILPLVWKWERVGEVAVSAAREDPVGCVACVEQARRLVNAPADPPGPAASRQDVQEPDGLRCHRSGRRWKGRICPKRNRGRAWTRDTGRG